LLIYPFVVLIVMPPAAFRRVNASRGETLLSKRKAVEREFERGGQWWLPVKSLIAAALLLVWTRKYGFSAADLGVASRPVLASCETGFVGGALLVCARVLFQRLVRLVPHVRSDPSRYPELREPVLVWLILFVLGGAFEESWRAFCLLACRDAGWNLALAVVLSSEAFVFGQTIGLPMRVPIDNFEEVWLFFLGLSLAVLFLVFGTVLVPYVASLVFHAANFFLIRRTLVSLGGPSAGDAPR
jgi:hypothetical protein